MLLGVMLLFVGAVLLVNGIWLIGQARAAELAPAGQPVAVPGGAVEGEGVTDRRAAVAAAAVENHPTFIQNREVTVLNIFTGFVGLAVAVTLLVQGNNKADLASVRGGGFILLFAFTYLWVAFNGFLDAGGRAFGWYCLFVAITAPFAGIYTLNDAAGNTASIWLGINWFAWAVLWFMFFALLSLDRPIARITGLVAIVEGIGTSWVFGFLLLEGTVKF
jgi:putative amide transporter protein